MASDPPHEAVEAWVLVEPPNIVHDVVGRRALDDLGRRHGLDIGNLHQLCSITGGPAQKPIESVKPGWMLLHSIKWIKKAGDTEYVPVVWRAL